MWNYLNEDKDIRGQRYTHVAPIITRMPSWIFFCECVCLYAFCFANIVNSDDVSRMLSSDHEYVISLNFVITNSHISQN